MFAFVVENQLINWYTGVKRTKIFVKYICEEKV